MRIIHFLNHTRRSNGHVEIAVDLACEQAAQGHRVALLSGRGDFGACLRDNGVEFVEAPRADGKLSHLSLALSLLKLSHSFAPDVVHAHMVTSALIARALQLPQRFHLVTTVHNAFDPQATLMQVGERVIAVSDAVRSDLAVKGIPHAKLRTVRNCTIGGKRRLAWPLSARKLEHPSIATVCGMHPRKGVADLIDAFAITAASFPDAHLYLVGDGPHRAALQARASDTACNDRIHFLGYQKDPREVLASADLFVLASHADPCPLVISEARQMGCAIVATAVDGIPELLGFGKKGLLVPSRNPAALAEAMSSLLRDASLRQHFADAAKSDLEECVVDKMTSATIAVYDELLETNTAHMQALL